MILVTGAAGKSGQAVVKALAAKGAQVRAFIRNPAHASALLALGAVEVNFGSFEDARALAQAVAGVQAIYHICPNVSRDEVAYARAVAAAARTHGVRRFVYHSVLHPQIEAMPHHWQKMRVEEMLFVAGFELTVLQPTAYMQNILGVWDGIVRDGAFRFPYPAATRLSLVDLDDVGEAAAIVLTQQGHGGATYELVGTPALSQTEVASALCTALGRSVRAEEESLAAWEARARAGAVGEYERATLAGSATTRSTG
jgi:NAD(P)H dehydrogenase (quinone)